MGYLTITQEIRSYSIIILFYFILIVFIWSLRGFLLRPFFAVYIWVYNFFALDPIPPQKPANFSINLPPKPSKN